MDAFPALLVNEENLALVARMIDWSDEEYKLNEASEHFLAEGRAGLILTTDGHGAWIPKGAIPGNVIATIIQPMGSMDIGGGRRSDATGFLQPTNAYEAAPYYFQLPGWNSFCLAVGVKHGVNYTELVTRNIGHGCSVTVDPRNPGQTYFYALSPTDGGPVGTVLNRPNSGSPQGSLAALLQWSSPLTFLKHHGFA